MTPRGKTIKPIFLSTSLGKMFSAWDFILNKNILFWLTKSYQKPFVLSVSAFCSQIFTAKLNLRPKIGLTYGISIVKWYFGFFFVSENILFFFAGFKFLMFHNNIVKISKKKKKKKKKKKRKKWTSGKICLQVTYPTDFCIICIRFYYGKSENIWFKKKKKKKKKKILE